MGRCKYAVTCIGRRTVYLHRFLMNPPDDMVVDHMNRDGLDNRKCNLRVVTKSENQHNKGPYRKLCRRDVFSVRVA